MKTIRTISVLLGFTFFSAAQSAPNTEVFVPKNHPQDEPFLVELGIPFQDISILRSQPEIQSYLSDARGEQAFSEDGQTSLSEMLSKYETQLPHKTKPKISRLEKAMLSAYLDHPNQVALAKHLAIYHLKRSLLKHQDQLGMALKHTIIAQYFLSRARDLGANEDWVDKLRRRTESALNYLAKRHDGVSAEENHDAHVYFNDTFNYHEENRYKAANRLLSDYLKHPNNVYTAFLNMALNLWVGGEAEYDDPTILYHFVLGSYFSIRAMDLARELEIAWIADPTKNERFRMATIIGGFSALQRRWLAKLHGDSDAIERIDEEHMQWYLVHKTFHMFTVGLGVFEEREKFPEGARAWEEGLATCFVDGVLRTDLRTCSNDPRFSFNAEGIFLSYVDFKLKEGDFATAQGLMSFIEQSPIFQNFPYWDLGKDAYMHRRNHLAEIYALYQNADQNDDPPNLLMKRRKWSSSTSTCQVCHQAQSKIWTEEQKKVVRLPPEDYAIVGDWPKVSTTWYGSSTGF